MKQDKITLERFHSMVRILSNSCWVRWWRHWQGHKNEVAFCAVEDEWSADMQSAVIYEPELPTHRKDTWGPWTVYVFQLVDSEEVTK